MTEIVNFEIESSICPLSRTLHFVFSEIYHQALSTDNKQLQFYVIKYYLNTKCERCKKYTVKIYCICYHNIVFFCRINFDNLWGSDNIIFRNYVD